MRGIEVAVFRFLFRGVRNELEAYAKLKDFLIAHGWIYKNGSKVEELHQYHVESDLECEVIIQETQGMPKLILDAERLFEDLKSDPSIEYVMTKYSNATEGIVYNNVDRYVQSVDVSKMKHEDMIIVFKTQPNHK